MDEEKWKEMLYSFWMIKGNTLIQFLLDAGLDVNALNKYGKTLLACASEWGNLELTEFLVEKGADGTVNNRDGSIPLHIATQHGCKEIVKFFLNRGISANSCDNNKCTPLHYIAQSSILSADRENYEEIVHFLVDNKANLNAANRKSRTPLLLAAHYCCESFVELFIKLGADVYCCDVDQWTVLHYCCWNGWTGLVRSLVEGRDEKYLNARNSWGYTPLLLAARNSLHTDIVELLIKQGANVDFGDEDGWTVLHYSCSKGWLPIVKCLVNARCDLNATDYRGNTPLLLATKQYCGSVVEYLIECGVHLECCDIDGQRALHHACRTGSGVVTSLIKKGCNVNAQTVTLNTPLHYAVGSYETKNIECLLKAGADWNLKNNYGESAFNKCIKSAVFYLEGVMPFIENGAYIQSVDFNVIIDKPELKVAILQNKRLCTQSIINQFNNAELPKFYKILVTAKRLPDNFLEKLRIASHGSVAQDIAERVKYEIQTNGYCDLMQIRPIVLSCCCVRSLLRYYDNLSASLR